MTTQKTIRFPSTLLFSLIPVAVAVGSSVQYPILPFHSTALWTVGICFIIYAISSLIAGPPEDEQWASYLSVTLTVAWLSMGIIAALWVLIIGELMAIGLRLLEGKRFTGEELTVREAIYRGLGRISAYGIGAICGYFIYLALGGKLPLRYVTLMQVVPIIGSLGSIYIISKGLQVFYREGQNQSGLFWKPTRWQMLFTEALLLLVAVILPIVLYQLGPLVFSALLILSVAQTYRQRQIQFVQQALVQRINDLATLNTVGQSVTSQLLLDDVLNNIYTEAQKIFNFPIFYIATYNSDNGFYEYRFIGRHGHRSKPPIAPIVDGLHEYLRAHKKSLLITKHQTAAMQSLGLKNWNPAYAACLGVALYVGDKFLGVMVGASETSENHFNEAERHLFEMIGTQASLAIRNAILYDRSVQMAHRLSLINQSVQDVMFNLDSEEGFMLACQTAVEVCQAQAAAIFVLDADTKTYVELAQSIGLPQAYKDFFQSSILASDLFDEQYQIVPNVDLIDDELQRKLAQLGHYSAYIYKTLRSGESQLGYLVIYHHTPYYFSQLELDLLETLTTQISSALDNAELLKSLEQYSSEQAQLVHLSKITSSSLELEKVATSIIDLLSQMMQVSSVMLGLTSPGRRRLQIFGDKPSGYDDSHIYNMAVSDIPEFEEILEKAASTTPIVYHYHETISPQFAGWMQERQVQRILIVPMVTKDEVIGLILLLEREPRRFRDVDWRLLETAANQITAQVQNAQIYTYTEEALLERLQQLALIEEIAQNISRELNLDQIILNVLDAAIRTTHADLASLALVQPSNKLKVIGRRITNGDIETFSNEFEFGEGVLGQAIQQNDILIIGDNSMAPYYRTQYPNEYHSSLAVPLQKDRQAIGALNLESKTPDYFREEQVSFIRNLAGHAVISIENANLLRERNEQVHILEQLRNMGIALSSEEKIEEVEIKILKTALQIVHGEHGVLFRYNADDDTFSVVYGLSIRRNTFVQSQIYIPVQLIRQALTSTESVWITHEQLLEQASTSVISAPLYENLALVPIQRGDDISYMMAITFDKEQVHPEQTRYALNLLATQAAGHLENTYLHERIRTERNRIRTILNTTKDGVILLDRSGILLDTNPAAEHILSLQLSRFIGRDFIELLEEYTHIYEKDDRAQLSRILRLQPHRATNREYAIEYEGTKTYIQEIGTPVRNDKVITGRLLVLRDITEEKALLEYRTKIQRMLFHDLRNPLSSIISSMHLLIDEIPPHIVEEAARLEFTEILSIAEESASRLYNLVDSLLDIGKLQRNQLEVHFDTIHLIDSITNATMMLDTSIRQANITVETQIEDALKVYADAELLQRVFVNLLHNAVKFTPEGGQIKIDTMHYPENEQFITVRISDSGPGIPPDKREYIFTEFGSIKEMTPERGGLGTGLGLTFCQLAIEAHGGKIWVADSSPLSGACIAFTVPLAPKQQFTDSTQEHSA